MYFHHHVVTCVMLSTRHPPLLHWRLMLGAGVVTLYTSPNITTAQQPGTRARGLGRGEEREGTGHQDFPLHDFMFHVFCILQDCMIEKGLFPFWISILKQTCLVDTMSWHELSGCHFLNLTVNVCPLNVALQSHGTACCCIQNVRRDAQW